MRIPAVMMLDGEMRGTLGIARSFGKKRIPIIAGGQHTLHRTGYSRYVQKSFVYPDPGVSMEDAHRAISKRIEQDRPDVLMPLYDGGWEIFYRYQDHYEKIIRIAPHPDFELYKVLRDKARLAECALNHGVVIPKSFMPKTMEDALSQKESYPYPVLLKARKGIAGHEIQRADNAFQLCDILNKRSDIPLIQECIEGEDLELTILCNRGQPIAGHVYLSIRNVPLPYGPPVACRSIRDNEFLAKGCKFLQDIGYHGVGHLDYRRDRRDGRPKLLDFNARVAGTNEISIRTGVDFAYMQYQLAIGERVQQCFTYELGREFRWIFPGELRHLAQTPKKLKNLRHLINWRKVSTEISLSDPVPHLCLIIDYLNRKMHSKLPSLSNRVAQVLSRKE